MIPMSLRRRCRQSGLALVLLLVVAGFSWPVPPGFVGAWGVGKKVVQRSDTALPRPASLTWNWSDKLGEGTFKEAYMGAVEGEGDYYGFEPGQKLVLKFIKPEKYNSGIRITPADIASQKLAQTYAEKFVHQHRPNRGGERMDVFFRVGKLVASSKEHFQSKRRMVLKNESMLVELPLYGKFEKFNSNTGWSSGVGLLPDAFSHWTWVVSNGEHLVCDLQGHRGFPDGVLLGGKRRHYYAFSDPAILSRAGTYGDADLGLQGQARWFRNHVCNDFCRSLDLEGKVPKQGSQQPCQSHTVYKPACPGP